MFTSHRPSLGFKSSYADPSLFIRSDGATGVLDVIARLMRLLSLGLNDATAI